MSVRRILFVSFLFALDAGATTTVTLQRGGSPVTGEVCRFRAGDRENPFKRWLASADVTCAPGASLSIPRGLWNVFAKAEGAISTTPLLVDGDAVPETLAFNLEHAATLVPLLPPKARAVAYAPRLGSTFPVNERGSVPAGETLWLFVLQESKVSAVIPIAPLAAGTEHRIDAQSGPSAVIGWMQVPESDQAAVRNARGLSTPGVYARVSGTTRDADVLPPLESVHGAFVRIANVSAGEGEVVMQGRGWMTERRRVKVEPALTVVAQPLKLRAVGSLIVTWSSRQNLADLDRSLGACGQDQEKETGEITISACARPDRPGEPPDPTRCSVIRQESFDPQPRAGEFTLDEVPPGFYRAELKFGKVPPSNAFASVNALQQGRLHLNVDWQDVYGGVTYGGDPLGEDATLTFPTGYAFATAEKSEYRGVVPGSIGIDAPIIVTACDGDPRVLVLNEQAHRRSTRLDIDIPANELTVTVEDTFTREPLVGAAVRMEVFSKTFPRRPTAASRDLKTGGIEDGESRVVVRSVPPERDIALHVSHAGYQKQTIQTFSLTKSERKEVHVQLLPLRGTQGKIVSQRPFAGAAVIWFSPTGTEVERADVAADGTFVYASPHDPNDTMAVVSTSHPLWVSRSPKTPPREVLTIAFPDAAPIRAFEVVLTGGDSRVTRHVGLTIGGVRVPQPVLRQHQTQRRLATALRGSGPLPLRDLLETGPIALILGPDITEVSPRLSAMDLFAFAPFNELPAVRLPPGATRVDLGAK